VRDDVIVLHAMRWPDEIRDPTELLPPPVEVSDEEIEGALALMDTMTRDDLEGEEIQDSCTEAIAQIIEAERENRELPEVAEPEEPAAVLDLMAALNESVAKAKATRDEEGQARPKKRPRRRRAGRHAAPVQEPQLRVGPTGVVESVGQPENLVVDAPPGPGRTRWRLTRWFGAWQTSAMTPSSTSLRAVPAARMRGRRRPAHPGAMAGVRRVSAAGWDRRRRRGPGVRVRAHRVAGRRLRGVGAVNARAH
jgi:DNA end-binding protein Ku